MRTSMSNIRSSLVTATPLGLGAQLAGVSCAVYDVGPVSPQAKER